MSYSFMLNEVIKKQELIMKQSTPGLGRMRRSTKVYQTCDIDKTFIGSTPV